MIARPGTFVIEIPPERGGRGRRSGPGVGRGRTRLVAGHRLRSPEALRSAFLEERGARRPSLFISPTAADLGALVDVAHDERGNLRLLVFEDVSPTRKEFLQTLFRTVVSVGERMGLRLLDTDELVEVISAANRDELFVGGAVNPLEEVVVFYRGSLDRLAVPFHWFERSSDAKPDFADFRVIDHGQTVRFGGFEAATDAVLYDFDPEYRARAKKRQLQLDDSLGGSIRRLRELRGVRRSDFGGISEKTIARIERGEVELPRERTVRTIARRLGVSPEALATY